VRKEIFPRINVKMMDPNEMDEMAREYWVELVGMAVMAIIVVAMAVMAMVLLVKVL
jgi:hypothetical protein